MRGSLARPDALYEPTRIYLMLGGAGPLDRQQVLAVDDARTGQQALPGRTTRRCARLAATHLDAPAGRAAAGRRPGRPAGGAARAPLRRVPPAQRVYASMQASAAALALPPWRPSDVLGLAGAQMFARASGKPMTEGIPGLYTAAGFRSVLLPAVASAAAQVGSENWVLGRTAEFGPAELAALNASVTALYLADFTARWDAMLADLNIAPVHSLPQAAQALYILSSPESPLRAAAALDRRSNSRWTARPGRRPRPTSAR